jgi:uncharacterized protein YjbJ (UPF0337 family)
MGRKRSKDASREGKQDEDKGWVQEAVGYLNEDDKKRTEGVVEGAADRIKEASNALEEGQAKEASRALSSGRRRDKASGFTYKVKGWFKEASGSLTGNKKKRAEGRANQLEGVGKEKKGHLKDLFKF